MDIEFDFKGDLLGGVISNCEYFVWIFLKFRIVKYLLYNILDIRVFKR